MELAEKQSGVRAESIWGQMGALLNIVRLSPGRRAIFLFAISITAVIAFTARVQVRLNTWQGTIYDAIGQRDVAIFLYELAVFTVIVSILLCLGVAQTWLHEMLKVRLREAVTRDLLDEWLKPMRAYRMLLTGDAGANPDQRMQEDTRRLSDLTADLCIGLVQSSLMLLVFAGVLWALSSQVVFVVRGETFAVPGYMVWCAIAYAGAGSFFTWLAGRSLIQSHSDLRSEEAHFRYALVRAGDSSEMIALSGGEALERRLLDAPVDTVIGIMRQIAGRLARLTWVSGAHGWIGLVAPMILAAPGYFGGTLTLGGLMMVVGAFYQVQQALRWYVERFPVIAEWRAMLSRIMGYRDALTGFETLGAGESLIRYAPHEGGKLAISDLCVSSPAGRIMLSEQHVEIAPGEHVLIAGSARSGKSVFFRAIAGLWIWGTGSVRLPPREGMMFLPQIPYVPLGTLRAALTYPAPPDRFSDAEVQAAMERVWLERFIPALDEAGRWDKQLSPDEQHRLVLGRVLLHRPAWVVQDESVMEMDEGSKRLAESIFSEELAGSAVVSFGRDDESNHFYQRVYRLRATAPKLELPLKFPGGGAE